MDTNRDGTEIKGVRIECTLGDITDQPDVDAVVNAANAQLQIGGGVAGAIHTAAGPQLERECRPFAPIRPGEAVITGAGKMANRHVIHTLGPVYGHDAPAHTLLADCYRNSLRRAEEQGLASIAFPALSTGAFGYPMREAAVVAMKALAESLAALSSVVLIRFVLVDRAALEIHQTALQSEFGDE